MLSSINRSITDPFLVFLFRQLFLSIPNQDKNTTGIEYDMFADTLADADITTKADLAADSNADILQPKPNRNFPKN
jgi:hypothetical protein